MEIGCTHRVRVAVRWLTPLNEICHKRFVYLLQPPFVHTVNGASEDLLCSGLVPASGCIDFFTLGRGSPVSQGQPLLLIAQGYLVETAKPSTDGCC